MDDDESIPRLIEHYARLHEVSLEIVYAPDIGIGVDQLNAKCCDAAIVDVILPGVTGVYLGERIREHDPHIPLAYLTNLDTDKVRASAAKQNAIVLIKNKYLVPERMADLLTILIHLAERNPCLDGGVRVDRYGFQRQLPKTPIEIAPEFQVLLDKGRELVGRAAAA